jgi:hypothetical protein
MAKVADRPAWYFVPAGAWRDWLNVLHPPYTLWHLSYVAIGAGLADRINGERLAATLIAFALAVGVAAHALDELAGRPLGTSISSRALVIAAALSLAGAVAIGAVGVDRVGWYLLVFVAVGVTLVVGYNLELFGGKMHNTVTFAAGWGAFPVVTGYYAQTGTLRLPAIAGAAFAFGLSWAQRILSVESRALRRDVTVVVGERVLKDGSSGPDRPAEPPRALRPDAGGAVLVGDGPGPGDGVGRAHLTGPALSVSAQQPGLQRLSWLVSEFRAQTVTPRRRRISPGGPLSTPAFGLPVGRKSLNGPFPATGGDLHPIGPTAVFAVAAWSGEGEGVEHGVGGTGAARRPVSGFVGSAPGAWRYVTRIAVMSAPTGPGSTSKTAMPYPLAVSLLADHMASSRAPAAARAYTPGVVVRKGAFLLVNTFASGSPFAGSSPYLSRGALVPPPPRIVWTVPCEVSKGPRSFVVVGTGRKVSRTVPVAASQRPHPECVPPA